VGFGCTRPASPSARGERQGVQCDRTGDNQNIGFYIGVIVLAVMAPKIAAFGYLVIAVVTVLRARGDSTKPLSTTPA